MGIGLTSLSIPVQGSGKRRVELRFDRIEHFHGADKRPVSAQLRFLGFKTTAVRGD